MFILITLVVSIAVTAWWGIYKSRTHYMQLNCLLSYLNGKSFPMRIKLYEDRFDTAELIMKLVILSLCISAIISIPFITLGLNILDVGVGMMGIIFSVLVVSILLILIDCLYGDIVFDYYKRTEEKNLRKFNEYMRLKGTLYDVKKLLNKYGYAGLSIQHLEGTHLYFVDKTTYVLLNDLGNAIKTAVTKDEIYEKHISQCRERNEISSVRTNYPFYMLLNGKSTETIRWRVDLSIYEQDGQICVDSSKTIINNAREGTI